MIKYITGNILNANAEALVNPVNCVGVMGKGLALQFKREYPKNFDAYKSACDRKKVKLGKMFVYYLETTTNPRYIINFPTKNHWRDDSHYTDIVSGLSDLSNVVKIFGIKSLAIPPIGCGLGGLDWEIVRPFIEDTFSNQENVVVFIYVLQDRL